VGANPQLVIGVRERLHNWMETNLRHRGISKRKKRFCCLVGGGGEISQ
jgi:hypothetical protein